MRSTSTGATPSSPAFAAFHGDAEVGAAEAHRVVDVFRPRRAASSSPSTRAESSSQRVEVLPGHADRDRRIDRRAVLELPHLQARARVGGEAACAACRGTPSCALVSYACEEDEQLAEVALSCAEATL